MKRHEIRELGGPGSGFHGHAGRPGKRGGSAAGGIPEGWREGIDKNFYKHAGQASAKVGPQAGGGFVEPIKKGFNLKTLKQSGLTQERAFQVAEQFLMDHPGGGMYRVGYTTKKGRQRYKKVPARTPYQAADEVREWMKDFWRISGDPVTKVMR